ncbi:PqiC family protein [Aquabacterium sp.]|uniref:PqiC family protein n=1 Tax=Aquabacterium sp. TaxID=1872578 RepID=UPI002C090B2B|nr:PqiC family protein [Aquabacterium sp.]HSW04600.1 PqiC family protein [Aquabacterium sp.]
MKKTLSATLTLAAALLAGCAASPPVRLYQLRAEPPVAIGVLAIPSGWTWQLAAVQLPDYLDRDAIVVPYGQAGLQAHSSDRWAEPLRSSVPRLLRTDLAALLGEDRLWTAPLPAGVVVTRQIRLELLAFEPLADLSGVRLRARWSVQDPSGGTPARNESAELVALSDGRDVDSLVSAHRLALWRLAERLAGVPATEPTRRAGRW